MSRIFQIINLSRRYHGSKGSLESQVEEPPLSQFGAPLKPGGECFAPRFKSNFAVLAHNGDDSDS